MERLPAKWHRLTLRDLQRVCARAPLLATASSRQFLFASCAAARPRPGRARPLWREITDAWLLCMRAFFQREFDAAADASPEVRRFVGCPRQ